MQVAWTRAEEFFYDTFRPAAVVTIDAVSGVKLTFTQNRLEILATAPEIGEARETMDLLKQITDIDTELGPGLSPA